MKTKTEINQLLADYLTEYNKIDADSGGLSKKLLDLEKEVYRLLVKGDGYQAYEITFNIGEASYLARAVEYGRIKLTRLLDVRQNEPEHSQESENRLCLAEN